MIPADTAQVVVISEGGQVTEVVAPSFLEVIERDFMEIDAGAADPFKGGDVPVQVPFFVDVYRSGFDEDGDEIRDDHVYIGLVPFRDFSPETTLCFWDDSELWEDGNQAVGVAESLQIVYERGALALARSMGNDLKWRDGRWVKVAPFSSRP